MTKHKKRIIAYVALGALAVISATLFVSWTNPLDEAVMGIVTEYDLDHITESVPTEGTDFAASIYYFAPGEELSVKTVQERLIKSCGNCRIDNQGDYIMVQDSKNDDTVRLQVEYDVDPGWESSKDMGAVLTVTRYGSPRRTFWDWIGGLFR